MKSPRLNDFPELRQKILQHIKRHQSATIAEISSAIDVTYEAVRQQMPFLERERWVERRMESTKKGSLGRPTGRYMLTGPGEDLFPKHYDLLAIQLIDIVASELGRDALDRVLTSITEARIASLEPLVEGKTLEERIEVLRDLYEKDDPYMEIESGSNGIRLVERNCPFLGVAMRHPAICSTSVSLLSRLLGVRVVREERFQSGDGRCAFRVLVDSPVAPSPKVFTLEPPKENLETRS
jgi:predicted ArsR family transcriptional regulator